ncbi:uncharacterized protein [Cicer arietinum]|uniref:uncharacterized protein n=1 Tax=Cicer arietinum TaxID=3827 RepID=UPI003CC63A0D
MVENKTLKDYAYPNATMLLLSIARPKVEANNFELKPLMLSMVQQNQFSGVTNDAIRLRLFPFSLSDRARAWLHSLPSESFTTWDQLKPAFLAKYFPSRKTAQLRNQITSFSQKEGESLYEAWERFKEMLRLCHHHGLKRWLIFHKFYNGLSYTTRMTVDAAAGGALLNKNIEEAYALIEDMAQNHYQWSSDRSPQKKGGRYEVDALDYIASKPEPNSKGQLNVVTLTNGKKFEDPKGNDVEVNFRDKSKRTQLSIERVDDEKEKPYVPPTLFKPPIPFPQRFAKAKIEEQFRKLVEVLKKLYINISFTEALSQMSSYSKFLKEVLSNKRKLDDNETIALTEECSAIIQKKLPPKLKDLGSFSIPCVIDDMSFEHALCDLGASISLVSL